MPLTHLKKRHFNTDTGTAHKAIKLSLDSYEVGGREKAIPVRGQVGQIPLEFFVTRLKHETNDGISTDRFEGELTAQSAEAFGTSISYIKGKYEDWHNAHVELVVFYTEEEFEATKGL